MTLRDISHFIASKGQILQLALLLSFALALRSIVVFGRTTPIHPDELFQYLEQAHRLAFGSAVVPWEYDYGIRSWLLPSLIAGVMKTSAWVSTNSLLYVYALRFIAAIFSLTVVVFGFKIVLPRAGAEWAIVTGFLCAIWFHAVFFSPSLLTEVLAAYLMFPAVYIAGKDPAQHEKTAPLILGALLGVAFCLRYQMVPALLVIACWFCRFEFRQRWFPLLLAASAVLLLAAGLLDYVTWGRPFQSIWLNYYLNAVKGASLSFGQLYWLRYFDYLTGFRPIATLPLAWLVLTGCYRAPLLAATCFAIVISHSFVAHKEFRFIAFVALSLPIFIGLGAATISSLLQRRAGSTAALAFSSVVAASVSIVSWFGWNAGFPVAYTPNTGILQAFVAAQKQPRICALGVSDYLWSVTGAYTYLNRDIPIYYSDSLFPTSRPNYYGWGPPLGGHPLTIRVVLNGKSLTQFPGNSLLGNTAAFNYLVARKGRQVNGYATVKCFKNETSDWPTACLLRREGGCSS